MNEQFKQLALQCGAWIQVYENNNGNNDRHFMLDQNFDYKKFAELIIRECGQVSLQSSHRDDDMGSIIAGNIKKHFGIQ